MRTIAIVDDDDAVRFLFTGFYYSDGCGRCVSWVGKCLRYICNCTANGREGDNPAGTGAERAAQTGGSRTYDRGLNV